MLFVKIRYYLASLPVELLLELLVQLLLFVARRKNRLRNVNTYHLVKELMDVVDVLQAEAIEGNEKVAMQEQLAKGKIRRKEG